MKLALLLPDKAGHYRRYAVEVIGALAASWPSIEVVTSQGVEIPGTRSNAPSLVGFAKGAEAEADAVLMMEVNPHLRSLLRRTRSKVPIVGQDYRSPQAIFSTINRGRLTPELAARGAVGLAIREVAIRRHPLQLACVTTTPQEVGSKRLRNSTIHTGDTVDDNFGEEWTGSGGEQPCIVVPGVQRPSKGLDLLVEAVAQLDSALRDELIVVVAGPSSDGFGATRATQIARLRYLVRSVDDLDRQLESRELAEAMTRGVVVLPYRNEFGLSAMLGQAASFGAPVVCSDFGYLGKTASELGSGMFVNGDASSLAGALEDSLKNPLSCRPKDPFTSVAYATAHQMAERILGGFAKLGVDV